MNGRKSKALRRAARILAGTATAHYKGQVQRQDGRWVWPPKREYARPVQHASGTYRAFYQGLKAAWATAPGWRGIDQTARAAVAARAKTQELSHA